MRLFTAIELTDEARASITAEQKRVVASLKRPASLRIVRSEHLHLTLVFIGEVPDERAAEIARAMGGNIPQPPFRIVFGGVGAFPPRGAPRALYLALTEGEQPTIEVHACVLSRLAPFEIRGDDRPFRPHLTLGRWKDGRPSDRPRDIAAARVAQIDVAEVALFQSRLSSSGPTYTRLAAARLVPL
jgi:RNA 2',3'-cyclic 3'-phosphodiesterase